MTQSIRISGYFMIILTIIILLPLLYITMRVKQLVWKRDKTLVIMLGFLCCSLVSFVFYFTFLIYSEYHLAWQNNAESQSYICSTAFFS
jgi:cytochrome c biogenesis factor